MQPQGLLCLVPAFLKNIFLWEGVLKPFKNIFLVSFNEIFSTLQMAISRPTQVRSLQNMQDNFLRVSQDGPTQQG